MAIWDNWSIPLLKRKNKTMSVADTNKALEEIRLKWERAGIDEMSDLAGIRPLSINGSRVLSRVRRTIQKYVSSIVRGSFEDPEWNFEEVQNAIMKESILRRTIEKYGEQIWKNGFEFVGKDKNTVDYIRRRFKQMAQVTGMTTKGLFQQMAYSLVAYGNIVLIKRRVPTASGGRVRQTFYGRTLNPVAGYFAVSPTTLEVDKDEFGNVRKWRQKDSAFNMLTSKVLGVTKAGWENNDVIHVKDNSTTDPQYFFAMPMAVPVINDIKALREAEELAVLQSVKFAIPRYHAQIGDKDRAGTQGEIDNLATYIDSLPTDAVVITSSRVNIKNVAEGDQVLELDNYLMYWYGRILAGLGMSKIGFGDGDSSNRNTAQTITNEMQNTTIKFQQILKDGVEEFIIRELLLEMGHTEETINEENMVYLHLPEIDLENKIKKENHSLQKFLSNGITWGELRNELGLDILGDNEQEDLFWKKIQAELLKLKAAAAASTSNGAVSSKDMPSNQHGTSMSKPRVAKDELSDVTIESVLGHYSELLESIKNSNNGIHQHDKEEA